MIGVPGTAHRLFGALREEGISVVMISQGSSEHSICFAVPADVAERRATRWSARSSPSGITGRSSAWTHDGMQHSRRGRRRDGGAARHRGALFQLARQGGRESARDRAGIVGAQHLGGDRRGRHGARAARRARRVSISPIRRSRSVSSAPGNVGTTLLGQLARQATPAQGGLRRRSARARDRDVEANAVVGPADRSRRRWREEFEAHGRAGRTSRRLAMHVRTDHLPHAVLIDCTASDDVARLYGTWLERRIHVITPNKRANTGPLDYYRRLRQANRAVGAHYLYETTVGAALPIVQTLRDLVQTGDEIVEIEGILSGTLSYLFNIFDGTASFSSLVAQRQGARLHGARSARRPLGHGRRAQDRDSGARDRHDRSSLADVDVKSLVPEALQSGSADEFLAALPKYDAEMEALRRAAADQGRGASIRRPCRARRTGERRATRVSGVASVRADSTHGQHRAVPHGAVQRQSAGGAGARRGARGHGRRRVRGFAAVGVVSRRAFVVRVSTTEPKGRGIRGMHGNCTRSSTEQRALCCEREHQLEKSPQFSAYSAPSASSAAKAVSSSASPSGDSWPTRKIASMTAMFAIASSSEPAPRRCRESRPRTDPPEACTGPRPETRSAPRSRRRTATRRRGRCGTARSGGALNGISTSIRPVVPKICMR